MSKAGGPYQRLESLAEKLSRGNASAVYTRSEVRRLLTKAVSAESETVQQEVKKALDAFTRKTYTRQDISRLLLRAVTELTENDPTGGNYTKRLNHPQITDDVKESILYALSKGGKSQGVIALEHEVTKNTVQRLKTIYFDQTMQRREKPLCVPIRLKNSTTR